MPETAETEKLVNYKDSWKQKTEKLLVEEFPRKVLELNEIISTPQFSLDRVNEFAIDINIPVPRAQVIDEENCMPLKKRKVETTHSENAADSSTTMSHVEGTPVMAFINGVVPCNRKIAEIVDVVKPIVREAVENVNKLKMWILFLIPRIEDGNNFGVSIQEETLAEVRTVEAEAASFLDQISRYYLTRGKIVSKVAKYPHVEDYRRSIQDLDEKEFLNLRLVLMEIRNHYSTLHDMIIKNFDKIKKPRTGSQNEIWN